MGHGGEWLIFMLDNQLFGVSVQHAEQIIRMQSYTEVPESPAYLKGVINLRGAIIPLIDLRMKLGKPEVEPTTQTCIIVNKVGDSQFGFIVDNVEAAVTFEDEDIKSIPQFQGGRSNKDFLLGIAYHNSKAVLLMDVEKVFSADENEIIFNASDLDIE